MPYPLHGVNLGNWLVLESWMNSTLFEGTDACDQWTFDSTPDAESKLQSHWATYITEDDFKTMASYGINAVRIPIGYWAYDNTNTPYIQGADAYLEKAIGWARNTGIKVLVDCHGSPGSQNGFDNSGRKGNVKWQTEDNLQLSIKVLEKMAAKYGSLEYADVVFGLELVNEPISWEENDFGTTKQWAEEAYAAVEKAAANKHLQIMMHDGFMGPDEWVHIGESVNVKASKDQARFVVDTHLYQNQMPDDSKLTQEEHIEKACNWTKSNLLPGSANLPVYVGEFSAATDICANPDGSTVAGTTCWIDGCQCANNVPIEDWQQPLKDATRKYMEAQMEAFDHSTQGWFLWSYHGYGAWGLDAMMKNGVLGKTLTDRKYSGICGF
ncbi:glycoside hydrolase family 5 protein [Polychaeton citri CBS 116435]|uniref:glucan 1,3-beta-glucosidase n=1 Tax=Polychaeton citri CBS 116435 TaxID=1314669 RepID=A0A9P4UR25_9PEZI|nr:glycoside hydrolase family 5 protein [Polychaeton citri CBS 116435]